MKRIYKASKFENKLRWRGFVIRDYFVFNSLAS